MYMLFTGATLASSQLALIIFGRNASAHKYLEGHDKFRADVLVVCAVSTLHDNPFKLINRLSVGGRSAKAIKAVCCELAKVCG
jgi:hypothetical protein